MEPVQPFPRPPLPVVAATQAALALLGLGVVGAEVVLVHAAGTIAQDAPAAAPFILPVLALVLAAGLCILLGAAATAVLVARVRSGRILEPTATRWVDALVGAVTATGLATVALVVVLRVADALAPGVMLLLVVGGLGLLVLDLVLLVLRSLLRRAIGLRAELDEVV